MYLQSEYTVGILEEISICSNKAVRNLWVMMTFCREESLGNDDVSSLNARKWVAGYDDVKV